MAKYLIDFDGVILDTQERFNEYIKSHPDTSWYEFLTSLDWESFIKNSEEINDSLSILREVQDKGVISGILTKVNSLQEASSKVKFLRENGITVPIMIVPFGNSKSDVYYPKEGEVLIDDYIKNIEDFIKHGGDGILFDREGKSDYINKVDSLEFLRSENP